MNNMKIASIALLIAALPLAPAAFASERDHDRQDRHESQRPTHSREHEHRGHHWGHEHRHNQYCHHDNHHYQQSSYRHYDGDEGHDWDGYRAQVLLPVPPLPPFPVFVVPKQHKGHIVLR